jgi:hypothetical protein
MEFENFIEDADFIEKAIEQRIITRDFLWPSYNELLTEKDLVCVEDPQGHFIIYGIPGKLTRKGIHLIRTLQISRAWMSLF